MQGTKRFAVSEPSPNMSDSAFRNKRIMVGSSLDAYRAEPSQQHSISTPPLDAQRAASSWQHVRALNTQFSSWVQTQLKTHPDELWEDGVRDYLKHASSIMEKFSDVVTWLKENSLKGESSSATGSHVTERNVAPEIKDNDAKLFQVNTGFTPLSKTTSFANSWSSGGISGSQPPVSFGIQNSVPINSVSMSQSSVLTNRDAPEDVDGENELEQPSSPSVKKSEEKGIVVVHEVKCKLYVKSSDPGDKDAWKDKGMGQLSIKCKEGISKGTKESKPTIIIRNDVGRVLLNALLYPGIKTTSQKNSLVAIFHTSGEGDANGGSAETIVARTFLIRLKSEEDRNKLSSAIQDFAPASSE